MANSDRTASAPVAPKKPATVDAVVVMPKTAENGLPALSVDAGDPDRIVAQVEIGGVVAPVTTRTIARAVGASYRKELSAMVHAQRLAAAVADGLLSMGEVPDGAQLNVKIELRRKGLMAKPAIAGKPGDGSASE